MKAFDNKLVDASKIKTIPQMKISKLDSSKLNTLKAEMKKTISDKVPQKISKSFNPDTQPLLELPQDITTKIVKSQK